MLRETAAVSSRRCSGEASVSVRRVWRGGSGEDPSPGKSRPKACLLRRGRRDSVGPETPWHEDAAQCQAGRVRCVGVPIAE